MAGFSSESARRAAQKSAEVRKAKRERAALLAEAGAGNGNEGAPEGGTAGSGVVSSATAGRVVLIRVPVEIGAVIKRLQADAKQGDSSSARELRAWLSQFPPDDAAADASDLDVPTRHAVASVLAKALAEVEGMPVNGGFREGMNDVFDAAPNAAPDGDGHPRSDGTPVDGRGSRPPTAISTPPHASEANGSHLSNGTEREALTRSASTAQEVASDGRA